MKGKKDILEGLRLRITQAKSSKEIISTLDDLQQLVRQGVDDKNTLNKLGEMAFHALQIFTADKPIEGKRFILKYLVPICIQESQSRYSQFNLHSARKRLVEWINQYPPPYCKKIRATVIRALLDALDGKDLVGSCSTLAHIGFRSRGIVKALWRIIREQDNETGDVALSTLTLLSPGGIEREKAVHEALKRTKNRFNQPLITTLHHLADRRSFKPILKHWLMNPDIDQNDWRFELAIGVLTDITDSAIDSAELQDDIWESLLRVLRTHPQNAYPIAIISSRSNLAPQYNSPHVVYDLLQFIKNGSGYPDRDRRYRYLIQARLADCVLPRQQEAWHDALDDQLLRVLSEDACYDTKNTGRSPNELTLDKEMAWETLLRLGCDKVLDWFTPAIADETNPFFRKNICDYLACFRLKSLPDLLISWITEEFNAVGEEGNKELVYRLSAIDIAWSTASMQSFEAFLGFGLTLSGNIPRKIVDALGDIALKLTQAGNLDVPRKLVETLIEGKIERHQTIAASALSMLAKYKVLPLEYAHSIEKCFVDPDRNGLQRVFLANIFGFLPRECISSHVRKRLCMLSENEDNLVATSALDALARHDLLINCEDLLRSKLGLNDSGTQWDILEGATKSQTKSQWTAYLTSWLHHYHPHKFRPAIINILLNHPWLSAVQVLEFWKNLPPEGLQTSEDIHNALIQRAVNEQKSYYSETKIFHYLALFAPKKLIHYSWQDHWKQWLPDARQALADVLGEVHYETEDEKNWAIMLLIMLMDDGLYAVRRAAYRAYSITCEPEVEYTRFKFALKTNNPIEFHKQAAEIWGWLKEKEDLKKKHERLYTLLIHDPEPTVRETVLRAQKERRTRKWADTYLQLVLRVQGLSNDEILLAWPYGKALARLGDDRCLQELRDRAQESSLPQNVRFWLNEIVRELEINWQNTIREWPQPWVTYEGTVLQGQGAIIPLDEPEMPASYTIWHKPAPAPSQYHEIRGMIEIPDLNIPLIFKWPGQILSLRLENGDVGKIMITGSHQNWFYFVNKGPFPIT